MLLAGSLCVLRPLPWPGELDGWEERLSADGLLEARRSKSGYTADIARCLQALRAGESYELCMTTQLRHNGRVDPWRLYTELRASNPSAHAAWLSFGDGMPTVSYDPTPQVKPLGSTS